MRAQNLVTTTFKLSAQTRGQIEQIREAWNKEFEMSLMKVKFSNTDVIRGLVANEIKKLTDAEKLKGEQELKQELAKIRKKRK
jgi:hypothetical protein